MAQGRVNYIDYEVAFAVFGEADDQVHILTAAAYTCSCGRTGVQVPCQAYEFPTCEACGQVVMPEREALEAEQD